MSAFFDTNILRPDSLADPEVVRRRLTLLEEAHVRPLTAYVRALRDSGHGFVPDFDPLDGGTNARLLFLQEKPGPKTFPPLGSGFISRDNDDPTARHSHRFMQEAGIPREGVVLWNTIPGWNETREFTHDEARRGASELPAFLALLPNLRGVVLVGNLAAKYGAPFLAGRNLREFRSRHTSDQARNGTHSREGWRMIPEIWRGAWEAVR